MDFSDYIVFVDESGDHGLITIDPTYPVFVLSFCVFKKSDYLETIPLFTKIKFNFFGHEDVILHAHDIRKRHGLFSILHNPLVLNNFFERLNETIEAANFKVISVVIHKEKLKATYVNPENPYEIAMKFCLEGLYLYLCECSQQHFLTHVLVESRGKREDQELELAFRRVCAGDNLWTSSLNCLDVKFLNKKTNSIGLQLADLVAHPLGRKSLKPEQENRAYDIIEKKFRQSAEGKIDGFGYKVFP